MAVLSPLWKRRRSRRDAAGFLLPVSSAVALLLLLSSLSLQTASLQERRQLHLQRQLREHEDLLVSAAHQLVGHFNEEKPCLLLSPGTYCPDRPDPVSDPELNRGVIGESNYRLLSWDPGADRVTFRLGLASGGPTADFEFQFTGTIQLRLLGLRQAAEDGSA